jgi:hypothetical protein
VQKLMAILPDGRVVTRRTDHDYRYVICYKYPDDNWQVSQWTASEKTARAAIRWYKRHQAEGHLVPVQIASVRGGGRRSGLRSVRNFVLSFSVPKLDLRNEEEIGKICHLVGADRHIIDHELQAVTMFNEKGWRRPDLETERLATFGWKPYVSRQIGDNHAHH